MTAKLVFTDQQRLLYTIRSDGLFFNLTIPADTVHVRSKLFANMIFSSPKPDRYSSADFKCGSSNFDITGSVAEGYSVTTTVPIPPVDLE
ncbi:hypothetical protein HK101_005181, partial [Irineochytrium annulatum]